MSGAVETIGLVALTILNAAVAVFAVCLSGFALWRQRALPRMEAQVVRDTGTGVAVVVVRNSGTTSAKAPWFMVATGGHHVVAHAGPGFLGVKDQGGYVSTDVPISEIQTDEVQGVVGCKDAAGKHLVWSFDGGRPKRRRAVTFEEAFRLFHPDADLGQEAGMISDVVLN